MMNFVPRVIEDKIEEEMSSEDEQAPSVQAKR